MSSIGWRRRWASFSVLAGLLLSFACCSRSAVPASDSREVCLIRTEKEQGLPRLYRRANAQSLNLGAARSLCGVPKEGRPLADRCEEVDDLSALLGTGKVCGPGGVGSQPVCPSYSAERIRSEAPASSAPLCSGGCANVQIAVHEPSGSVTRIVFYDDPACHRAAEPGCEGSEHACYYRVLALTSELR
jgi:hypothetical protein